MADCPKCRSDNPPGAKFCLACGASLGATCSQCDEVLPVAARFCPACGTPAGPETQTAEMIKLVTILFCDVVGSTAQAERMLPEDVRALMADFLEAMSEEIRAEGGTIERYIGDALMADFGVPVAREDDPIRAVRAARRMVARLEHWNAAQADASRYIQIRIGINTGEVSTGGSFGKQLLVMGDAVNVAARLEQIAEPGSIVIGPRTARSVRKHFELEEREPITLKGISEQIPSFVVTGELHSGELSTPFEAPLVGRTHEFATLAEALGRVIRERAPQLVTVIGDPGVGKSRLIAEFVSGLEGSAKAVYGRCLPVGGVTLWPLREILRTEAGVFGTDPADTAFRKIASLVERIVPPENSPDTMKTAAALASSIGLEAGLDELEGLDPRELYREVLRAWRALLSALSSDRPLVVVIEDLHWAEDTTLGVLQDLERNAEGQILLVCPSRPELLTIHPDWPASFRSYLSISLEPLDLEHSALLVKLLVGLEDLPEAVRYRILERGEGNPFFLEEILRHLIDEGYLTHNGGRWSADERISEVQIPDNVHSVILSRIDLLSGPERNALQLAAVIGRTFWAGALRHLSSDGALVDLLSTLQRRQLITERATSSLSGEEEYMFSHVLIRDVAYDSLPRPARGEAHMRAAEWIEKVRGERAGEVAELLTYHYERAHHFLTDESLRGPARHYSLVAARNALRRFAVSQAELYGRRAVDLSSDGAQRVDALEALGDVYQLSSKGDDAWATYSAAVAEAEDGDADATSIARLAGKAAIIPTRFVGLMDTTIPTKQVTDIIDKGLGAAGASSRERCLLLLGKAFLQGQGYEEPDESGEEAARGALDIAEQLGDPDLASAALDAMASRLNPEGRHGEIARITQRRLDLIPELKDVYEVSDIYGSAAYALTFIGRYEEAVRHATLSIEFAQRASDVGGLIHALNWRSQARFMAGDWDGALDDQAQVERLEGRRSEETPAAFAIRSYGVAFLCHELRGDRSETEQLAMVFRRYYGANVDSGLTFLGPLALPARALAHGGHPEEARSWLLPDHKLYASTHLEAACEIVAARAAWDEAEEIIAQARAEATHGELVALPLFADRLEGRLAFELGDHELSQARLRNSADGFQGLGAPWEEASSRMHLARTLKALQRADDADRELAASLAAFERLASGREVEECRALKETNA